jgi:hypothetical protein
MDDRSVWQPARTSQYSTAKRDRSHARQLAERFKPGALLDRPRDALRHQEPPWDPVPVPRVDDDVRFLVEKVSVYDFVVHALSLYKPSSA